MTANSGIHASIETYATNHLNIVAEYHAENASNVTRGVPTLFTNHVTLSTNRHMYATTARIQRTASMTSSYTMPSTRTENIARNSAAAVKELT